MKHDQPLAQSMANSTHALRENFDGWVKEWQAKQKQKGEANGVVGGQGKHDGVSVEQVEVAMDANGKAEGTGTKRKILGFGTSVAVD